MCLRKRIGQRAEARRHTFKIVRSDKREKIPKLIASPLFPGCMQFSNNLACKRKVWSWTSPFMHGWRYLETAKSWCMKAIRYKVRTHIHRYRQSLVGDSDWRCLQGYRSVDKRYLYDTSDYFKDHPLYSAANNKVFGKMKDEIYDRNSNNWVCLPPAKNVLNPDRGKQTSKSWKAQKVRCEKRNRNEHYKKALFGKKTSRHEMNMPGNEGHEIYRVHVNKILLSPLDLKRFLAENGMDTSAYGYRLTDADKSLMLMIGICWG